MSTFVRADEAARILGVSTSTLYAYVSRGRVSRRTGADGRSSLFARDEVEALASRSRRAPSGPRPSIDVRITSAITKLDEDSVTIRGHDLADLAAIGSFEDVAELLWSSAWPTGGTTWPAATRALREELAPVRAMTHVDPIGRLAMAALLLDSTHPDDNAADAARRLLIAAPNVLGSNRQSGRLAHRLASAWVRSPSAELVDAIDTALLLLADHELATSTLAVRVAASVRSSPCGAFAAGLTTVQGTLHGSVSNEAHRFFERCMATSPGDEIGRLRRNRELVPGFGHKVYRGVDPRYPVMLGAVRALAATTASGDEKLGWVDQVVAEVGRLIPRQPNIDLALGALTWVAGLAPGTPIFAVARIAGWAAHYTEELDAPPVRYRGVTS